MDIGQTLREVACHNLRVFVNHDTETEDCIADQSFIFLLHSVEQPLHKLVEDRLHEGWLVLNEEVTLKDSAKRPTRTWLS
jgi:hypothetical protein